MTFAVPNILCARDRLRSDRYLSLAYKETGGFLPHTNSIIPTVMVLGQGGIPVPPSGITSLLSLRQLVRLLEWFIIILLKRVLLPDN
jgi:hypothetical protein